MKKVISIIALVVALLAMLVAVAVAAPQSLLDIANTGFTCTRKALN